MADSTNLAGPLLPAAQGDSPKKLVILLHGYGADARDLMPLAVEWQPLLPDAAFVSLDAPSPCPGVPGGRQWFPLVNLTSDEIRSGLSAAGPLLDTYIDRILEEFGLDANALALVGFSQGAMMALHVGLGRTAPIGAIVSFSGVLAVPPPERNGYSPVMLTHGAEDQLIPPMAMEAAQAGLEKAGIAVEAELRPGLAHGIDPHQVARAGAFVKRHLRADESTRG